MMTYWAKLNPRERTLASVVAGLVFIGLVYMTIVPARAYMGRLDEEIVSLEGQLMNYAVYLDRSRPVDEAFAEIAAEHGSSLTRTEIHDGLRKEIFRLTARDMPATTAAMTGATATGDHIIQFVELPEGDLREGEEGYREYSIEFDTMPCQIGDLVMFLRRVQDSPMSLRVTSLDMRRDPESNGIVRAHIGLARTVVDGVPADIRALVTESNATLANGSFEEWKEGEGAPGWEGEGVLVSRDLDSAVDGAYGVRVEAQSDGGTFGQSVTLLPGAPYRLTFSAMGTPGVSVSVTGSDGSTYGDPIPLQETLARYDVEFMVPPDSSGEDVVVPQFSMAETGAVLYLDNVILMPLGS